MPVKTRSYLNYINQPLQMDGLDLMFLIPENTISTVFFDPQYRGTLDKMNYGNEGVRQKGRSKLQQMSSETIVEFISAISQVLIPSGYLFFWMDKFHLVQGDIWKWLETDDNNYGLEVVDCITWNKDLMAMGYRSRNISEFLLVLQKLPKTTKNWTVKNIPDVWTEKIEKPRTTGLHPHRKPVGLIEQLILATTEENDIILDPCAGSFSVMGVSMDNKRFFLGCDLDASFYKE